MKDQWSLLSLENLQFNKPDRQVMKSIAAIATIVSFAVIILIADSLGSMPLVWAVLGGILLGGFGFLAIMTPLMVLKATAPEQSTTQRSPASRRIQSQPEPKKRSGWLQLLHLLDHLRK
jgi:hypothetical protein